MSEDILAEVAIIFKKGSTVTWPACRISLDEENRFIRFTMPSDAVEEFSIKQFVSRPIKVPTYSPHYKPTMINLTFDKSNELNKAAAGNPKEQMKILLRRPHDQFAEYVAIKINDMFEASKSDTTALKVRKGPPQIQSSCSPNPPVPRKASCSEQTVDVGSETCEYSLFFRKSYTQTLNKKSDSFHSESQNRAPSRQSVLEMKDPNVSTSSPLQRVSKIGQPPHSRTHSGEVDKDEHDSSHFCLPPPEKKPFLDKTAPRFFPEEKPEYQSNRRLENIGNSCYFNATMQALSSCSPLANNCLIMFNYRTAEIRLPSQFEDGDRERNLINVFTRFLEVIVTLRSHIELPFNDKNGTTYTKIKSETLRSFKRYFGKDYTLFDNDNQQDAHEFLMHLLGMFDDLMMKIARRDGVDFRKSPMRFGSSIARLNPIRSFRMSSEVCYKCQSCDIEKIYFDAKTDLSLSIQDGCSVQELLVPLVKWSAVEKECADCDGRMSSTCERIAHFPPCLIINLKRYEREERGYKKKTCVVKPSFDLDASVLANFSEFSTHPELEKSIIIEKEEDGDTDLDVRARDKLFEVSCSPIKCRGGSDAKKEEVDEEEPIVEKEIINGNFVFEWMAETRELQEINEHLEIHVNPASFTSHTNRLQSSKQCKMGLKDEPGEVRDIMGDGNCFYRAISWCLTGVEEHYDMIRQKTVQFVDLNEEDSKLLMGRDEYDEFRLSMEKNHEWADTRVIIAVATMLNVNIYTFLDDKWTLHCPRPKVKSMFPPRTGSIYLQNVGSHYEPVLSLQKNTEGNCRKKRTRHNSSGNGGSGRRDSSDPEFKSGRTTTPPRKRESLQRECKKSSGTGEKKKCVVPESLPYQYTLSAVVCHLGASPDKGHYVAYTKNTNKGDWTHCSDTLISEASLEEVTAAISDSGYILFYTRT